MTGKVLPSAKIVGITGLVEVPEATGLKGKVRLHLASAATLAHGVVHLRYMVEPLRAS